MRKSTPCSPRYRAKEGSTHDQRQRHHTAPKKLNDLSPDEKRALLARLLKEKAGAGKPVDASVHRLFEAQAARTPEAPAVVFDGTTTTYGELNARANRLARHLRTLGVGPETLVGLCVERSTRCSSGCSPSSRRAGPMSRSTRATRPTGSSYMLDDSAVPVLLTESALAGTLPTGRARVVAIDADDPRAWSDANLDGATPPDARAYVIYTSGSTGKPKGVRSRTAP